jgi:flagella basal body P-ring formation protein FlgA
LLGAYVVRKELHKPAEKVQVAKDAKDAKPQTFPVPMASNDLEPGRKVTLGDITMMKLTAAQMKSQHISGNYMSSPKQIIGRVLKEGLKEGSTFDTPDFYP